MKNLSKIFLLLLILSTAFFGLAQPSDAATYYVRTDGNDSNLGTSNTSSGAWLTIQKAADTMVAGDTVLVQPGTYYEMVQPLNSGNSGNPITYQAQGTVVIDGGNTRNAAFELINDDYIVIDGFEITNCPDGGGYWGSICLDRNLGSGSDYVIIRNNIIHDTGRDGINVGGTSNNALIENNLIYNIDDDGITPAGNGNHTLRNNTIYNCVQWGLESAATSGNLYEDNIFWDDIDNTGVATYNYNDYSGGALPGTGNISSNPLFVNASAGDFHLSHVAAGQGSDSPCIDTGSDTAVNLGYDSKTTRTDNVTDSGTVDIGFHYAGAASSPQDYTQRDFRWYQNADAVQPTIPLAGENTAATLSTTAIPVRVRMNVTVGNADLGALAESFKLQYATNTGGPWTDVGTGEGTLLLGNPNSQVADQLTGLSGTTPTDTELVGLELSTTSGTSTVSEIVANLSYAGIVDADVDNFRLYKDLGAIGTYESGTDTLVDTVAGNPTSGTVTFNSLSESIGISPTHYLIIYDFANGLSVNDQIAANIGTADITTTASAKSGDLTNEPTHTATAAGSVSYTEITSSANLGTSPGGGSIVIFDGNNDGYLDVALNDDVWTTTTVRLRQNNGDNTFTDRDSQITLTDLGRGLGSGDFNNDGWDDLIWGYGVELQVNSGQANISFTLATPPANNDEAMMFADIDGDGDLDIWNPGANHLWQRNDGGTTFVGQTTMPGPAGSTANGEGATAADINNDGYIDFLWANSATSSEAYTNNGNYTYTLESDVNTDSGAGDISGLPEDVGNHENMEWAWGDCDNDGDLDVFISGADNEGLYINDGDGDFTNEGAARGVSGFTDPDGADWGDVDNDGDLDLIIALNGGVSRLYINNGSGSFTDSAAAAGIGTSGDLGKTVGFFDSDNDGDLDILINDPAKLWRNDLNSNSYLRVVVNGRGGSSYAPMTPIGAQIDVYEAGTSNLVAHREIFASFNQLQPPKWQHIGLPASTGGGSGAYDVTVTFPSSGTTVTRSGVVPVTESITIGGTTLDQTIEINEGELALANPSTQVVNQLGGEAGNTPIDVELVGLKLNTFSSTAAVSQIVVNLSYTGIVDADVNNFRLYQDLGTIGTYDSGTDTLVDTVAGNPTGGTVTFGGLGESIGTGGTQYLVIYNVVNPLSADDQITASIGPSDITTAAMLISGDLTNEPTHTAANIGVWQFYDNGSVGDGTTITSTLLSASEVNESYGESNPTASNPNAISVGQEGEWDYALDPVSASSSTYYFRMVESDGTPLNSYTNYPTIIFDCEFAYRKKLTIDFQRIGTSCSSDLSNFPVLISLAGNWLKTIAQDPAAGRIEHANGYDILFRASDGITQLDHEIEKYDGVTGTLVAWVRIPTLDYNDDTEIYIYYGNACINSVSENSSGVWDSNFVGVWHLNESPNDGVAGHVDSSGNNNPGTPQNFQDGGGGSSNATGKIGGADYLAGDDDMIRVFDSASLDSTNDEATFSLWINWVDSADGDSQIVMSSSNRFSGAPNDGYEWASQLNGNHFFYPWGGNNNNYNLGPNPFNNGTWHRLVVTLKYSTTEVDIYIDGTPMSFTTENVPTYWTTLASPDDWLWGGNPDRNTRYFAGSFDEIRVSDVARSACWIETEYNNHVWPNTSDTPSPLPNPNPGGGFIIVGLEEGDPPTAVDLVSLTATGSGNGVRIDWHTGHEIANLGFNIYRATGKGGPYQKINTGLIPGLNYSALGQAYSFMDTDVSPGTLYFYKLEDIDVYGKRTMHGPVCVDWDADGLPDDWEMGYGLNPWVNDADIDSDGDGLTNLQEYELGFDPFNPDSDGDGILDGEQAGMVAQPDDSGSRVLTRGIEVLAEDQSGVTLELITEAFYTDTVDVDEQEFERLRIEEYLHGYSATIGEPQMPLKGILLDIPEGMSASLRVLETEVATHSGYQIYPVPEAVIDAEGFATAIGESFVQDQSAYDTDVFYPQDVAGLAEVYTFRDQTKQQVVFYPLSFNPISGDLRHYRRIRVRIDYVDDYLAMANDINPTPWKVPTADNSLSSQISSMGTMAMAFGASPLIVNPLSPALSSLGMVLSAVWAPPADFGAMAYKIITEEAGIYRIYRADLALDDDLSDIRLYNLGEEVAVYIYDQNSNDFLDADDYIEFYAQPVAAAYAKYARHNVYWLVTAGGTGSPKRMVAVDGTPAAGALAADHSYLQHSEQDAIYRGDAPGADDLDRWYYSAFVLGTGFTATPNPVPADFALPVFGNQGPGRLRVSLWGYADTDHDLEVWVNGVYKDTFYWSGIAYNEVVVDAVDVKDSVIDQNAQSGTLNSITLAAEASVVDDIYNEMLIEITAGEGIDQVRKIVDYNGTTKVATVETNWGETPDASSIYRIDSAVSLICDSGDDAFLVDWFELTYDRSFSAVANNLQFTHDSGYRYLIDDFSSNDLLVFDITDPENVAYIENAVVAGSDPYSIEFEPPVNPGATETYLIISAADYKSPVGITEDASSDLTDTDDQIDYILITHKDIGWDGAGDPYSWLDDLVDLREDGGLSVKVVDIADIYDEFSYGLTSPVAIRDFLAYAYASWPSPAPQYVLLVGDGSFDYKDNLDIGTINYVPGYMVDTAYMGEAITDEYFAKISGEDAIADMYIGRLPAASEAAASAMVAKIKNYEQGVHAKDWRQNVLLLADDQVEAYEAVFELMNEDAIALLPSKMVPLRGYLGSSTPLAITNFIDANIGSGALIMNYSGHGALQSWGSPFIFEDTHVAALDNSGKYPFVIGMSCLAGNFGYVSASKGTVPSLAETLLQADSEGAVAALMPTGMSTTPGQYVLNTALFEAIFTDDIRELGPAILAAKQTLLANGSAEYEEISQTFLLFGDPALDLKIPLPRMPTGVAAYQEQSGVRMSWNAALDSNGSPVAGYHVYRASSPAGPYSRISTELITGTGFMDTSAGLGADAGGGRGYYYAVSSEDADGDESVQSLGISPASMLSSAGSAAGCFIGAVAQEMPYKGLWILSLMAICLFLSKWYRVQGIRYKGKAQSA